ncbi:MAG: hypothetical protein OEM15_02830 [Myxococcales bacterium]|nr:hypothetical protein [Myxococcales bacterium]MDH3484016.1 hypothetical protein [Myxococcales bacterium]
MRNDFKAKVGHASMLRFCATGDDEDCTSDDGDDSSVYVTVAEGLGKGWPINLAALGSLVSS